MNQSDTVHQISSLELFAQRQMGQIDRAQLSTNSTHAMLCATFISGAAKQLRCEADLPTILRQVLDVTDRGAEHMVTTSQRLVKKYPHLEAVYERGEEAARLWQQRQHSSSFTLQALLTENRDLSLVELEAEAARRRAMPGEEEKAAVPGKRRAVAARRWLWWLLLLAILAAANYVFLIYLK